MQKTSNSYILVFVIVLAVFSASILAFVSESLRPLQNANIALEQKKSILTTFMGEKATETMEKDAISSTYDSKVKSVVIDFDGKILPDLTVDKVSVAKEYKEQLKSRKLPVYEIYDNSNQLEYVVLPVYGYGLWDNIWGYVALEKDLQTIKGVVFAHKGETPGLGSRIATDDIQNRYIGKKIKDEKGNIVSVVMQKGEKGGGAASIAAFESNPYEVDGMSGATITGKGVNQMLNDYFICYENYFKSKNNSN